VGWDRVSGGDAQHRRQQRSRESSRGAEHQEAGSSSLPASQHSITLPGTRLLWQGLPISSSPQQSAGATHPKIEYCMSRCGASPRRTEKEEPPLLGSLPRAMDSTPEAEVAGGVVGAMLLSPGRHVCHSVAVQQHRAAHAAVAGLLCAALHCAALHCAALHCAALHCAVGTTSCSKYGRMRRRVRELYCPARTHLYGASHGAPPQGAHRGQLLPVNEVRKG
jgi:hypothetical protein